MSDEQPQRPITDDRDAWRAYWQAQSLPPNDPTNSIATTQALVSLIYGFIFARVASRQLFGN